MLDFQQKRKVRSLMYNRTTLIILSVIVLILLHSTWRVYQKKRVSEEMKKITFEKVEELRKRSEDLKSKIERLETTPGVEEEIRSRYSVVKENEAMVVIVPSAEMGDATTTMKRGFWATLKSFFQ